MTPGNNPEAFIQNNNHGESLQTHIFNHQKTNLLVLLRETNTHSEENIQANILWDNKVRVFLILK